MTKSKCLRLVLVAAAPLVLLVSLILVLQGGMRVIQADGPGAMAALVPPIHHNLSSSSSLQSRAVSVDANQYGVVTTWSEGSGNPNGVIRMRQSTGSGWHDSLQVADPTVVAPGDNCKFFDPSVALDEGTAHFVWAASCDGEWRIYYRSRNLQGGTWDQDYPYATYTDGSGPRIGSLRMAVTADGVVHVVWARKGMQVYESLGTPYYRDRIYYGNRGSSDVLLSDVERISGLPSEPIPAAREHSEDMPAMVAIGNRVYVAWREKGESHPGIYARYRTTDGDWHPDEGDPLPAVVGDWLSAGTGTEAEQKYDGLPAMGAAGGRVYVIWERYVGLEGGVYAYSMTYRVANTTSGNWWPELGPNPLSDAEPAAQMKWGQSGVIYATSAVNPMDHLETPLEGYAPYHQVPGQTDYHSGVRPAIAVGRDTGTGEYTPFVAWHDWDDATKGEIPYAYLEDDDLDGAPNWDLNEGMNALWIWERGEKQPFAYPHLVLTEATGDRPYDLHLVLGMRLGTAEDSPWDVMYTNPFETYWLYLTTVLKGSN